MAVPKKKTSPSRRGMRRSADALKQPTYVEDKDSGELRRPHHIDLKTGMYKGRQVLKAKAEAFVDGPGLAGLLPLVLTAKELASLRANPHHAAFLHGGVTNRP